MKPAYYNEIDLYCAAWLRNLIAAGHIPAGEVDTRDIREVSGDDLKGFGPCHFFAGIGGWAYAGRLAGIPDDEPLWTGSCPCQPLSSAGQRKGHADERHLWPAFYELIAQRRPATVFGEQVASKLGREWISGVRTDLEHLGHAVGIADLPAACIGEKALARISYPDHSFEWVEIVLGAPNIRQRIWWVAHADGRHTGPEWLQRGGQQRQQPKDGRTGRLADAGHAERRPRDRACDLEGRHSLRREGEESPTEPGERRAAGGLGDAESTGLQGARSEQGAQSAGGGRCPGCSGRAGFWSDFDLMPCADGKARRVEPGTFPLAHGVPARVGKLRAYGNAIVPQLAAEFIRASMECRP